MQQADVLALLTSLSANLHVLPFFDLILIVPITKKVYLLDKIIQIHKICTFVPNHLKAIAKKDGSYVE